MCFKLSLEDTALPAFGEPLGASDRTPPFRHWLRPHADTALKHPLHFNKDEILESYLPYTHNINVEGLLVSRPWVSGRWLLEPLFPDPPRHQKHCYCSICCCFFINQYIFLICIYVCIYLYIYIYIYREREREMDDIISNVKVFRPWNHLSGHAQVHIYIYIYICTYIHT